MARRTASPNRVHLVAHASPIGVGPTRFGLEDLDDYIRFAERMLPDPLQLTYDRELLSVEEDAWHAGRSDDKARVRDLQKAINDKRTVAIVSARGGAYFSRLLPHLDLSKLAQRTEPLWVLGFSEMSSLVGLVASYRCGRGLYWLCPDWLGSRLRPAEAARAALGEFWRTLPDIFAGRMPEAVQHLHFGPIEGELKSGRVQNGRVRIVGGCLSVLANVVGGPFAKRLRPDSKWLMLEDIKESPYRIDRHLASLKVAGWFEKMAGLLIGDFHMMNQDTQPALLDLLKFHLPSGRKIPIVTTREFGHVWPMVPVLLNRSVNISVKSRRVQIDTCPLKSA